MLWIGLHKLEKHYIIKLDQIIYFIVRNFYGKKISRFGDFFAKSQNLIPANIKLFCQPEISFGEFLTFFGQPRNFGQLWKPPNFSEWYTNQVRQQLDEGKEVEQTEVKFTIATLKPIHVKWPVHF